jgi:DNA repair exonuclease SbcCD ATPase subunit
MLLEYAELENVCQHVRLVHSFGPGLIGIFGPNGAGKSNFVNMIQASLTGDFRVNPGVKDDNIRGGIGPKAVSQITTRWNHTGTKFTVRRGLQNIANSLLIEGDKNELRGTNEINASIESIIGLSRKVVDFMFVPQWKIFSFISEDATERATTFSHLCGTALVEKAHRVLGEQIRGDQSLAADILDNRTDIQDRIGQRTARIREMQADLRKFSAKVLKKADGERYEQVLKTASKQEAVQSQLARTTATLSKLVEEYDKVKTEKAAVNNSIKKLLINVESSEEAANEAKDKLKQHKAFTAKQALIGELKSILAEKPYPKPPAPLRYNKHNLLLAERAKVSLEYQTCLQVVNTFDKDGVVACPTCLTPVTDLKEHIADHRARLPGLERRFVELNAEIQSCENHRKALETYERETSQASARKAAAKAELDSIEQSALSFSGSPDDWRKSIDQHAEQAELLAGTRRRLQNIDATYNACKGRLMQATEEHETLEAELKGITVSASAVNAARRAIEEHRAAKSEVKILEARIGDLQTANSVDAEEIERIALLLERSKNAREWLTQLDEVRDFTHRDNFPRLAAQRWLEDMTELINQTLEQFDSPFYVEASEDLTFVAIKPNGRRERASRLSGGEKVLLALAFRFAVNSLLAGDVGMMILDEPTAGVDTDNISSLTDMLALVSDYTKKEGKQLILITHDDRLERAFDQIVRIDKVP